MSSPQPSDAAPSVGPRLRAVRLEKGVTAASLARTLGISPSAVSQIERGTMTPSVARLIAITDALGVSLASILPTTTAQTSHGSAIAIAGTFDDPPLTLSGGVTFRRLTPGRSDGVDYFESVYPPGSRATGGEGLFLHDGYEVGEVISGVLTIVFRHQTVEITAGQRISYDCAEPHSLRNLGSERVVARWLIVHPRR